MMGTLAAWAGPPLIVSHALSVHSTPRYPAGFTHFDYVNPDAPKGGSLRLGSVGTYDSFNRYAIRGSFSDSSELFYDTLMTASLDEIEVYYGLVAEKVEYPADYAWIIFHINPKARFQDGKKITADDVVFSFNKFMAEGVPQFHIFYADVKPEALDTLRVKFTLKKGDKAMLVSLAGLAVLPRQFWESHKLSEPITDVPLGSGAYTVKDYKIGQYVVYERLKDYWGMNLPVNKGQLNFDAVRYDYYRDETVAFEAFKAGEYDFYQERIAKNWATLYKGRSFDTGAIVKEEIPDQRPQGMQAMIFNVQRPIFNDRRVRRALSNALDFQWMNKNLFYNQYARTRSYFTSTLYEAKGLPGKEELAVLDPLRGKIPDEVFTREYNPPVTDGSGNIRDQIREALRLLKEAGWEIRNEKMVNVKTGEPLAFEMLLWNDSDNRVALPIQKNLQRMGVTMNIRMVDPTQYQNRVWKRDFDMVSGVYAAFFYPSTDVNDVWRSNYIDSTYNLAGVQDPAVDSLVDGILANQEKEQALLALGHALDRVLTWNFYVIPEWHVGKYRIAYWNKFSRPKVLPRYSLGTGSWWLDTEKEARLPGK
jgi:microcin C transport system substrate-binding protein